MPKETEVCAGEEGYMEGDRNGEGVLSHGKDSNDGSLLNLDIHLGPSLPLGLTLATLTEWPMMKTRSN